MTTDRRTTGQRHYLKPDHPVATVFMDETGSVSADRYFAIGCLKLPDPSVVLREIQRLRDRHNRHNEVKFTKVTKVTKQKLDFYREFVDCVLADPSAKFFCFIADRAGDDPVTRFGTQWDAYAKLAEQLVHGVTAPDELLTILADNYSTPHDVRFEPTLRRSVNRRMHRLTVTSVVRLDSRTSDGLQLVDLLTSAIAFEFRAANGLAGSYLKTELSNHVRDVLGADSCLDGFRSSRHSIAIYNHGSWRPRESPRATPARLAYTEHIGRGPSEVFSSARGSAHPQGWADPFRARPTILIRPHDGGASGSGATKG